MLTKFVKVANVTDLAPNEMRTVKIDQEYVFIARLGDEYFALDGFCSHADGFLADGYLHETLCEIECPIHEGAFDLRTGEVTNPPAEDAVVSYIVRIEGEDIMAGPRDLQGTT
jgi:nitrite reductase/ring-hydroxylating ferredoxin subunit